MNLNRDEFKKAAWIGLPCFVAYAGCYEGKNILSALMPQLISEGIFTNSDLGSMGSAFFLLYGIGQLINGLIGNKVSAKWMVSTGLFVSGLLILLFPMISLIQVGMVLWGACGFLCSMLWGPMSGMIVINTSGGMAKILLTLMTIASILGTAITYLIAMYSAGVNNWQAGFYISGIFLIIVAIVWMLVTFYLERSGLVKPIGEVTAECAVKSGISSRFLNFGFIAMVIVTMLNGVIRNAVTFWIPTFLSEHLSIGVQNVAAISSVLPVVNIIGTFISLYALRWMANNDKTMCVVLFSLASVLFVVIYLCGSNYVWISVTALFIANATMMATCNMIFSVYILDFGDTGKISGITGFLDFTSYLSASITSTVFAKVLTHLDWNAVICIWIVITVLGTAFSWMAKIYYKRVQIFDNEVYKQE